MAPKRKQRPRSFTQERIDTELLLCTSVVLKFAVCLARGHILAIAGRNMPSHEHLGLFARLDDLAMINRVSLTHLTGAG